MSETNVDPIRVALAVVLLVATALLGLLAYKKLVVIDGAAATTDRESLTQLQHQLTDMEMRLEDLEKRRKAEPVKASVDAKAQEATEGDTPHVARTQYQVSPASAVPQPAAAPSRPADTGSAEALAQLQEKVGALQDETTSNHQAWQATTNRLADVAGELGTQDGQIIQNQEELKQFLARAEHRAFTFELHRDSTPAPVGPVRLSLQNSNQKSRRYTLCVYVQDSACVQVKDRVLYEVVQLAVAPDTTPLELIATKVGKDGIVGYLEVPNVSPDH